MAVLTDKGYYAMADEEMLMRLKRSVNEWNRWREEEEPNLWPDLTFADLAGMDLRYANLAFVTLEEADLRGCDLAFANLGSANLKSAKLEEANLSEVELWHASLWDANVSKGNLSSANLDGTILKKTRLTGTNFSRAHFCDTLMVRVDLSSVMGLETAIHDGPSSVDINSVVLPTDEQTRLHFLRGVGFSDAFIDTLPVLLTAVITSPLCFLSYANQDEVLTRRLYRDLQEHGVRCWMIPHDLDPVTNRIGKSLQPREKVVLVLSEHIVDTSWAKFEVHVTLKEELKQDCTVLFPLRVDESVMQTERDWAIRLREGRPIGDFTNWREDRAYQQAFTTLLHHLKGASTR